MGNPWEHTRKDAGIAFGFSTPVGWTMLVDEDEPEPTEVEWLVEIWAATGGANLATGTSGKLFMAYSDDRVVMRTVRCIVLQVCTFEFNTCKNTHVHILVQTYLQERMLPTYQICVIHALYVQAQQSFLYQKNVTTKC
ncbi:hypothetical protein L226DRAFT_527587 [Lentinus tigrinus ALCF2SS1-7]|uniref:Uncharacterized protein n=1 Tax=Lentinus tigrinus ALCF2SS1-6 TaxID=1328759 RepID=A0A5C2RLH6_9APHY|nr:hypothetical protein L227DRAFT_568590 [Lentinus tigrinus ALCF2SS1-6]RPD67891.1 hypothetical protein L226DRAFT_527587 [Lentinus tigrinus ALCF2SS1-7]